ncbi:hypothetical protein CLF_101892 [Clonorchis sinensis]|uniref:Uncharacterized protein n=1 Tax=Clonorchis sinensis TaxID=79923 RepID=G7Y6T3_CLOSI|nr:hypothetical protein CLF_101892 [Clonorchis sinensis]
MRNHYKSEICQRHILNKANILNLARKNRNVPLKCMRLPQKQAIRVRLEEQERGTTNDPTVVSEENTMQKADYEVPYRVGVSLGTGHTGEVRAVNRAVFRIVEDWRQILEGVQKALEENLEELEYAGDLVVIFEGAQVFLDERNKDISSSDMHITPTMCKVMPTGMQMLNKPLTTHRKPHEIVKRSTYF